MISRRELLKTVAAGSAAFALSNFPGSTAWAMGCGPEEPIKPEKVEEKVEEVEKVEKVEELEEKVKKVYLPKEALARLVQGNQRYVSMNRLSDPGIGPKVREPLTKGQWPYATILCCSDSRVPPELIFDEGLGRLFIVRVAGNILNPALLGSIEYASVHSTSRLIMVMGHESCGAVGAAVHVAEHPGTKETAGIDDIINRLMPAVMKAQKETGSHGKELVEAAAKENVRMVVKQIADESEPLRRMRNSGDLKIVGAYYSLTTGEVDIWA